MPRYLFERWMKINRELQLNLLKLLSDAYPQYVVANNIPGDKDEVNANLHYLIEHDLVNGPVTDFMSGERIVGMAIITAAGIDFLADDGGLSAILGVVTVKLHEESIRQLLVDRVSRADLPAEQRSSLLQAIRNLPARALQTATEKLLENGADQMLAEAPRLYTWLIQLAAQQAG
jgi:hypothetical protein